MGIVKLAENEGTDTRLVARRILDLFFSIRREHEAELGTAELVLGIERCMISIARSIQNDMMAELRAPAYEHALGSNEISVTFYAHDGTPMPPIVQQQRREKRDRALVPLGGGAGYRPHVRISDFVVGNLASTEEVGILTTHGLKNHMVALLDNILQSAALRIYTPEEIAEPSAATKKFSELVHALRKQLLGFRCQTRRRKPAHATTTDPTIISEQEVYMAGAGMKDDIVMALCFIVLMCGTCSAPAVLADMPPGYALPM